MASNNNARHGPRDPEAASPQIVTPALSLPRFVSRATAMAGLVAVILVSTGSFAAGPARSVDGSDSAGKFITGVIYKGMAVFQDPRLTQVERDRRFARLVEQNLDIQKIARFTLGRYWNRATEQERRDYVEVLPGYLAQAFAGRISQFAGALVQVVRTSRVDDNTHVVTRIYFIGQRPSSASTSEIEVGWLVGQTSGSFRVEDIDLEGTSLELVERTDVTSRIERIGATVTAIVNDMRVSLGQTLAGP